jgi:hypothetical protein
LEVTENKVLREILGPKRAEVTKEWEKLRCEELCLSITSRKMKHNN